MSRQLTKKIRICAAISIASVALTYALSRNGFIHLLNLKASDAHSVVRGTKPVKDIVIVGIDNKTLNQFPELYSFWHPYYADAVRGAAMGGAKVFTLDVTFQVPVTKYEPANDALLAAAVTEANQTMPIVCGFVPGTTENQKEELFAVPLNMLAAAMGMNAFANLTTDQDDFVRRQELIETPKAGMPMESLTRGMALRTAEKFFGEDAKFQDGGFYLKGKQIPLGAENDIIINFAGPSGTIPRVSLSDFVAATRAGDKAQLEKWVKGKAVLLGPDNKTDRYSTPFFTFFAGGDWLTPGVEIHANTLNTILTGNYLRFVPEWVRFAALSITALACVTLVATFSVGQTILWSFLVMAILAVITHILFLSGWLLSTSEIFICYTIVLFSGITYRFATAERKSSFFKSAVALFVGKQVASSLEKSQTIGLTGKREMVTILFTDIRGFTAFCESKDPGVVVGLLNVYMKEMVGIIVRYNGHVNKFIGDGILAVFSDDDEHAKPGDHALRATQCATEIVNAPGGGFKTGAGLHSGEVVIGNVGSEDKMEFTVLGDTVNLASRLESLNKENKTKLLLSEATREMIGDTLDTHYLGTVPVRGKTVPMKLYTMESLIEEKLAAEKLTVDQVAHEAVK